MLTKAEIVTNEGFASVRLSVLAVEHVLMGMLWLDTRWRGLAEVRRGCPGPLAAGPYYCSTTSKQSLGPEILAVPLVFGMRNTECNPYRVAWKGIGFLPCM